MAIEDAETPGRQHQQTGPWKQDPDEDDRQRPLVAREAGRDDRNQEWRREDADEDHNRDDEREQSAHRPGDAIGLAPLAARHQRGVHGNERRGERPFTEQVLENVRDAKRGVERVGGVGLQAEVMREDAQPHEAGQTAQQDARGDEKSPVHSASSSTAASPSVPLDFFIRNVLMKPSRSPSSTRLTSPTCSLVRWSFTSWYGWRT